MAVQKKLPFAWYEVDAIEAWLDAQVQQGLQLVSIDSFLGNRNCFFEQGDDLTRYRIHVKPKRYYSPQQEADEAEYRQTMEELGWRYVARLHERADVYQAMRPDAVEINTDEDALREALRSVMQRELLLSIITLVAIPILLKQQLWYLPAYDGFYDLLLDGMLFTLISTVLFLLMLLVCALVCIFQLLQQRKRYLLIRECDIDKMLRQRKRFNAFRWVICAMLILCFLTALTAALTAEREGDAVSLSDCPVALLEDISPNEAAQLDYDAADPLDTPFATSGHSLFYSYTTYRQDGPIVWIEGTGSGYHSFSYWVGIRDIRTETLAERYYAEKLSAHDDWQLVTLDGWDEAAYRTYTTDLRTEFHNDGMPDVPSWQQQDILLRSGAQILSAGYSGAEALYPRLNELYGK